MSVDLEFEEVFIGVVAERGGACVGGVEDGTVYICFAEVRCAFYDYFSVAGVGGLYHLGIGRCDEEQAYSAECYFYVAVHDGILLVFLSIPWERRNRCNGRVTRCKMLS